MSDKKLDALAARLLKEKKNNDFDLDKILFDKQLNFVKSEADVKVLLCSRRCLAEGTLVKTVNRGLVPIEEIKIGDLVWGYNEEGSVSPTRVVKTWDNGIQDTLKYTRSGKTILNATPNHRVLTVQNRKTSKQKEIKDLVSRDHAVQSFIPLNNLEREEIDRGYVLGAIVGDGCCTCSTANTIVISSGSDAVPNKVASVLGGKAKKLHHANYSYSIPTINDPVLRDLYDKYCANKRAAEKIIPYQHVALWPVSRKLGLFAGLLETDGSVYTQKDGVVINFGGVCEQTVHTFKMLLLELFNYDAAIHVDKRKYKSGTYTYVKVKSAALVNKILSTLDPFIVTPSKKFKEEYSSRTEQRLIDRVGLRVCTPSKERTYDITVDNQTNLYLLGNGIVTHNSGKSYAITARLVSLCMAIPHISTLYISLTAKVAKNIILPIINPMVEDYDLPCKVEEHSGRIKFNNGSEIQLHGVKDATEVDKFRGMAPYEVVIDEAGHFNSYLDELVDEVIQPMLMDYDATLVLAGTPPKRNTGVFYKSYVRGIENPSSELKSFHWTFFDNPGLPSVAAGKTTHQKLFNKILKKGGLSINDPIVRREYFGECVEDLDGIVFKTTAENVIEDFEHDMKMRYVLGVDTGSGGENDASGYAVLAYIPGRQDVWVIEAFEDNTEGFSPKVEIVRELSEKYGGFETVVVDPAASGKDLVNELHLRHRFHAQSASKMKKEQFIEFMNDDIRTNRLKVHKPLCEPLLFQWNFISWERKKDGTRKLNSVIKGVKQDHVSDACLYAWRECKTYIEEKTEDPTPDMGSKEWFFYQLKRQEEKQEGTKRANRLARIFNTKSKRKLDIKF